MTIQIIEKLKAEIHRGFDQESQVVYLLVGVRKVIEQEGLSDEYPYLKFHCDWVLHSELNRSFSQRIIREFDSAHSQIISGGEMPANGEASKISGMDYFREQLDKFFRTYGMRDVFRDASDWTQFLYIYAGTSKTYH